jgi:hypothetical protein
MVAHGSHERGGTIVLGLEVKLTAGSSPIVAVSGQFQAAQPWHLRAACRCRLGRFRRKIIAEAETVTVF